MGRGNVPPDTAFPLLRKEEVPLMIAPYDCQTCGACCFSPWTGDGYVRLYDLDRERLEPLGLPVVLQTQGYDDPPEVIAKLGTKSDEQGGRVCVAFEGRAGQACACGIYAARPEACRQFEVGGLLCQEARRCKGLAL
jgi:Fe-S-cluster containining protein